MRHLTLRAAALCGFLAPLTFLFAWVAGGLAQPDSYSFVHHDVSDLGALTANQPWIYNRIGANLTGLLIVFFALGLSRVLGPRLVSRLGEIALLLMGVGQFLDGWFRLDCRDIDAGCSQHAVSWHQNAHDVESLVTVIGWLFAPFLLARAFTHSDGWRDLSKTTLLAGVAIVVTLIVFAIIGIGLAVRVAFAVWGVWLGHLSFRLLQLSRKRGALEVDAELYEGSAV